MNTSSRVIYVSADCNGTGVEVRADGPLEMTDSAPQPPASSPRQAPPEEEDAPPADQPPTAPAEGRHP